MPFGFSRRYCSCWNSVHCQLILVSLRSCSSKRRSSENQSDQSWGLLAQKNPEKSFKASTSPSFHHTTDLADKRHSFQRWYNIGPASHIGPTVHQHWVNVSCSLLQTLLNTMTVAVQLGATSWTELDLEFSRDPFYLKVSTYGQGIILSPQP